MTATQLTDREQQVRDLVAEGLTNADIALQLNIAPKTVESHLRTLFRKLGISRREQVGSDGLDASGDPAGGPEAKLRKLEEQLDSYETALRRITARQTPLFSERVDITVTIGDNASEDAVVERRWTTPKPYLVYRVAAPILPDGPAAPPSEDDLGMSCEVVGQDVGVAVETFQDRKRRYRTLVTFQPGLQDETEWVLQYRTPGMWNPLRDHGEDQMFWLPGVLEGARATTSITELRVSFLFPEDTTAMDVTEWREYGVTEEDHLPDGRRALRWRQARPGGASYRWLLKMTREPR